MIAFTVAFVFSLLFYLTLTAGSGPLLFWSAEEIFFGIAASVPIAVLAKKLMKTTGFKPGLGWLNPARWVIFLAYIFGPFLFNLARANIDVACRVVTGKIRPGIVRISPGLRSDLGVAMLANSITLTPGTMTVDVDDNRNLYIHWIYVKNVAPKTEDICATFPKWVRRIAE